MDQQSKHTPGPWMADKYGVRDVGGYICQLIWPHRYEGQDDRFQQETARREGDAALIAAAPDLLDALIDAISLLDSIAATLPDKAIGRSSVNVASSARATIAKAEGR